MVDPGAPSGAPPPAAGDRPGPLADAESTRLLLLMVGRCAGVLAVLVLVYAVVPLGGERWWVGAVVGLSAIALLVPFTVRRARKVWRSDRPVLDAAEALTILLGLLVLGFSAVYLTIGADAGQFQGLETRIDAVYFTVTTLSTVGFGDISASGQAARIAVVVQIVFNFALVGIAVRLISAAARERLGRRP